MPRNDVDLDGLAIERGIDGVEAIKNSDRSSVKAMVGQACGSVVPPAAPALAAVPAASAAAFCCCLVVFSLFGFGCSCNAGWASASRLTASALGRSPA